MKKVIISIFIILFLNSSTNLGVIIFKYPAKTIKSMLFYFYFWESHIFIMSIIQMRENTLIIGTLNYLLT